jgi:hypothetical protein
METHDDGARDEKVLVLVLGDEPDLRPLDRALHGTDAANVRLVAPAHVGPLEWYGTDEDAARDEARQRAEEGLRAVGRDADGEARSSGPDPVLAVEDALSEFPADRIVVAGPGDAALGDALRRFGKPVELLEEPPAATRSDELREAGRAVMSGRSRATPYVAIGGVMLALGAVLAGLLVLAALVLWVF